MDSIKTKITIFGAHSGYNKGDLAILLSMIKTIESLSGDVLMFLGSKKPKELNKFIKSKNVVINKDFFSYFGFQTIKNIKNSNFLIFGGGGLFFSKKIFSLWYNHVFNLFLITIINNVFFHKPIYIFSVGCSHLDSLISKLMVKYILSSSTKITVRDYLSMKLLKPLTKKDIKIFYDPAFLLKAKKNGSIDSKLNKVKGPKLIFCINGGLLKNKKYLVEVIKDLQKNFSVFIYENSSKQENVKNIFTEADNKRLYALLDNNYSPEEIIYLFSKFDFVISAPMHGSIFSYNAKSRLISIEYNDKVEEFNKIIKNRNILKINDLKKIHSIINNYQNINFESTENNIISSALNNFKLLQNEIKNN